MRKLVIAIVCGLSLAWVGSVNTAHAQCAVDDAGWSSSGGGCQDLLTGNVWSNISDFDIFYQWDGAVTYCEDLNEGGTSDWRLATFVEIEDAAFNGASSHFTWDTKAWWANYTSNKQGKSRVWTTSFYDGTSFLTLVSSWLHVVCVSGTSIPGNGNKPPKRK